MSADRIIKRTNLLFWEDGGTDSKKKILAINDAVYLARPRRVWLMGWSG